ncbi:hypothetical protein HW555_001749 [Spodoptera exigua]|uniref:Uncharacterized protein n=1 Tax=Spodoptera exigua TaxID=7107 RepID=A0A835GQU4_SPOEX|nr:hypothetical protein HW555_001749 [Spodoptera exigua]
MEEKSDGDNAEYDLMSTSISFADGASNNSNQKDCEMESVRIAEKRGREKGDESCSEEDFITVIRRRPKRLLRSESGIEGESMKEVREEIINDTYKMSLTSLEVLPKQMALARLLKNENIQNILKINYKSPYKVFIHIAKKEDGEKLMNCQKLVDLGIRIQFVNQLVLSYGIIKGVDLELSESEILESLESSCKILSVRRLRRISQDREWVNSETVRVCFESTITPEFVLAYGCRFRVERYVFPVSQCSNCWKYGHIKKFCPIKKILCPKCSKEHENCETDRIVCPNCKGPHIALDKTCPVFLKEKEIRNIMSLENVSYKKGLEIYLKNNSKSNMAITIGDSDERTKENQIPLRKTYSNAVQFGVTTQEGLTNENASNHTENLGNRQKQKVRSKNQSRNKDWRENQTKCMETEWESFVVEDETAGNSHENSKSQKEEAERKKTRRSKFVEIFLKIKDIIRSERRFEEIITSVLKVIYEEFKRSSPDITLASSDIAIKFHWAVMNENLGSDHLILKISMNFQEHVEYKKQRNFKKANWEAYRQELIDSFSGVVDVSSDIQVLYDYFVDQVEMAANKHIPMIKICNSPLKNFKPKEYWDPSLSRAVAERRLALAKFRRNPTPDNLTRLEEKGANADKLIRKAKDSSWKLFCSSIDETSTVSDMWRKMRWLKGYRQPKFNVSEEKLKGLLYSLTPDSNWGYPKTMASDISYCYSERWARHEYGD